MDGCGQNDNKQRTRKFHRKDLTNATIHDNIINNKTYLINNILNAGTCNINTILTCNLINIKNTCTAQLCGRRTNGFDMSDIL